MTSLTQHRVVIDSNVWISALVFGGQPRLVFERILQHGGSIVVCEELFTEIRRILHAKFPAFLDDFEALVLALQAFLQPVQLGSIVVTASRDTDDNRIIESAVLGNANTILSGDKDLLILKTYEGIAICTPREWLEP